MKIDYTKSGMNKWSILGLFIVMVAMMFWYSIKAFNAPYNAQLQLGEFIAYDSGDTEGYIQPIESFIQTGEYEAGSIEHKTVGRGPYYGLYYGFFRQFLPVAKAYDAVVIMQIFWYALAIIVLMLIVEPYIKYKSIVWIIPLLTCFLHIGFTYLPRILTDPIAVSQLICFVYFYVLFNREGKQWQLWVAALFLAMASVMKPYLLPIYAICFMDWVISNRILEIKRWIKYIAIMSVPLVIICIPFTIHNAVKLHIFAPVQNTAYGGFIQDPVNAAMRNMVRAWGENHVEWGGLGTYFMPCEGITFDGEVPDYVYTLEYNKEDIVRLAQQCREYDKMDSCEKKDSLRGYLVETMINYRNAYIAEHPLWRVRATVRQLGFMVLPAKSFSVNHRHSGLRHIVSNGINFFTWILSWSLFIVGVLGLCYILVQCPNLRIIPMMILFLVVFFSLILFGDARYYILGQLFEIVGMGVILDRMIQIIIFIFSRKNNEESKDVNNAAML